MLVKLVRFLQHEKETLGQAFHFKKNQQHTFLNFLCSQNKNKENKQTITKLKNKRFAMLLF